MQRGNADLFMSARRRSTSIKDPLGRELRRFPDLDTGARLGVSRWLPFEKLVTDGGNNRRRGGKVEDRDGECRDDEGEGRGSGGDDGEEVFGFWMFAGDEKEGEGW